MTQLIPWRRVSRVVVSGFRAWQVGYVASMPVGVREIVPDMTSESERASGRHAGAADLLAEEGGVARAVGDARPDRRCSGSRRSRGLARPGRPSRGMFRRGRRPRSAYCPGSCWPRASWRRRGFAVRRAEERSHLARGGRRVLPIVVLVRRHERDVARHARRLGSQVEVDAVEQVPLLDVHQELTVRRPPGVGHCGPGTIRL